MKGENMNIENIWAVYFSPTENTKKIVKKIAQGALHIIKGKEVKEVDFTLPSSRKSIYKFTDKDLVIIGCPTYAGRLPNKIMPFIKECIFGNGTLSAAVVTYGGRAYDDSLKELCNLIKNNGFNIIGTSAFVCKHAFANSLNTERPSNEDLKEAYDLGGSLFKKTLLSNDKEIVIDTSEIKAYYIPKKIDGSPAMFLKAKPKTNIEKCISCGICSKNCPMGSISYNNPSLVEGICIKCQSCITKCPKKAKYFDDEDFLSHKEMLEKNFSQRTISNEIIL